MKTLKTLLTTLAAGIMTLSPVITLVQAVEKTPTDSVKEDETLDVLKSEVDRKKEEMEKAKAKLDEATPVMEEVSKNLETAKTSYDLANTGFNSASQELNAYVTNEITFNQATVDEAKKELEALKNEKERLEKKTADSQAEKNRLEAEYKDMQAKYDALVSDGTVEDLNGQIESQKQAVEIAKQELSQVQAKYDEEVSKYNALTSEISSLEANISEQQTKVDALNVELSQKLDSLQNAQAVLDQAQQAYDAATDETAKAQLQNRLEEAKTNFENESLAYEEAKASLEEEEKALTQAELDIKDAEYNLQNSIESLNNTKNALAKNQQQLKEAQNIIDAKQQLLDEANKNIEEAKKEVEAKKSQLDAFGKTTKDLTDLVQATKAAYDAVLAQWNQGSLGFYESIDDKQAADIIQEGVLLGTTHLGSEFDATSLDGMKRSIPLLLECNRLRKLNGVSELKTSALMMAISQVKINHSYNREGEFDSPHTHLYGGGENIAAGFTWDLESQGPGNTDGGRGPFVGWYSWEKQFLEDFYNEHPEEKDKNIWESIGKYPDLYNKIGHYLNMLSDGYTVTGAAYLQRNEYDKQWTTGEFAQEFMSDTKYFEQGYGVQSEIDENKVYNTCAGQMSVEEFQKLFDAYYANLKQELRDKKVAYEAAKEALEKHSNDKDSLEMQEIMQAYDLALTKLENAQDAKKATQAKIEKAVREARYAKDNIEGLEYNLALYQQDVVEQTKSIEQARKEVEKQRQALDMKTQNIKSMKNNVDNAKNKVDALAAIIENTKNTEMQLKNELNQAKDLVQKTKLDYDSSSSQYSKAYEDLKTLYENKAVKENVRNDLDSRLADLESNKNQASVNVENLNQFIADLKTKKSEIETVKGTLDAKQDMLNVLKTTLNDDLQALNVNKEKFESKSLDAKELEAEASRLQEVMSMYHSIVDGVLAAQMDGVTFTGEEFALFENLKSAIVTLDDAQKVLSEAQASYNSQKQSYTDLKLAFVNAKQAYSEAQNALNQYLHLEQVVGVSEKVESENVMTVSKSGKVNTGVDLNTELYLGTLVVAGTTYVLIKKKEKEVKK